MIFVSIIYEFRVVKDNKMTIRTRTPLNIDDIDQPSLIYYDTMMYSEGSERKSLKTTIKFYSVGVVTMNVLPLDVCTVGEEDCNGRTIVDGRLWWILQLVVSNRYPFLELDRLENSILFPDI